MPQRTGFFLAALSALAFQGCLTETGGSASDSLEGEWVLTREIVSVTANGNTVSDTVKADTGTYGRSFLIIEGTAFKFVDFDALFETMDTLRLTTRSLGGGRWLLDGDTVTVTRTGSLLRFTLSTGGGHTRITEFTAHAGVFPPAEWTTATGGNGTASQIWLGWRDIYTWSDGTFSETDTTLHDTADVISRFFFRFSGDSIYLVAAGTTRVIASERVAANRWLHATDEEDEGSGNGGADTITITLTGNRMTAQVSGYDSVWGEFNSLQSDFVAYTGAFPPAEWAAITMDEPNNTAAQATPIVVDAAARPGYLVEEDADWFSFTAQAGKRYRISTFGGTDTYLRLYGTNGATLLDEVDDDTDLNAAIYWTAPSSGTHYFSVRGFEDKEFGTYTVSVVELAQQAAEAEPNNASTQANPVVVGAEALSASLVYDDADWFSFAANAGTSYRIRTYGSTDTYLRLYGTNGSTLLDEEDDDTDMNASIEWTAPSTGTYYFSVRGFQDGQAGSYTLDVQVASGFILPKKSLKDGVSGKRSASPARRGF